MLQMTLVPFVVHLVSRVLGPLLFLIFINDVEDNMTGFGRLFADDTCIGNMAHNEENLHTCVH